MKVRFTLILLLFGCAIETPASDFPCPDEQSRELYARLQKLNVEHPLSRAETGYSELIEQSSKRPMDDVILHGACFWLANRTFRANCSDYGYECPSEAELNSTPPADINNWIPELKSNVPALAKCPDVYIRRDSTLPVARFSPKIPRQVVQENITGWVVLALDLDEFGKVENIRVTSSTSSKLEESAVDAARQFQYQRQSVGNEYVKVKNLNATVHFSYWSIAEAAGCPMNYD